ncbi:hypothetical protein EIN_453220 [Entamoeba invadens IP1]|uniref:Uncharacterized protein n=1 Tax=Entamoeba invadens IP1 TaxID=370355 RepID=L7FP44_ENTIV|nr:hypothetical protein EIN_453220 [Entamoeba invadens IP1]ELP89692.1 hypothetical protein EIN_453220 [Entamoeba invadens IP1]|eukprot:XP_004256463.1 hypothetical protein EIN_453220 [Entamoeba invadens IP1]
MQKTDTLTHMSNSAEARILFKSSKNEDVIEVCNAQFFIDKEKFKGRLFISAFTFCMEMLNSKKYQKEVIYTGEITKIELNKYIRVETNTKVITLNIKKRNESIYLLMNYLVKYPFLKLEEKLSQYTIEDYTMKDSLEPRTQLDLKSAEQANEYANRTNEIKTDTIHQLKKQRDMLYGIDCLLNETEIYFEDIEDNLKSVVSMGHELVQRYRKSKKIEVKPVKKPEEIQLDVMVFEPKPVSIHILICDKGEYKSGLMVISEDTVSIKETSGDSLTSSEKKKRVFSKEINIGQIIKLSILSHPLHLKIELDSLEKNEVVIFSTLLQLIVNDIYLKFFKINIPEGSKPVDSPLRVEFEQNSREFEIGKSGITDIFMFCAGVDGQCKYENLKDDFSFVFKDPKEMANFKRMRMLNLNTADMLEKITQQNKEALLLIEASRRETEETRKLVEKQRCKLESVTQRVDIVTARY